MHVKHLFFSEYSLENSTSAWISIFVGSLVRRHMDLVIFEIWHDAYSSATTHTSKNLPRAKA